MKAFRSTLRNMRRSPYQAIAAVLIMMLTFLVVSFFTFVIYGSSKVISFFESQPQVTAFFKETAKQEDINNLEKTLQSTGKVAKMKYVSKQAALQIYRQQNKDEPLLLDLVTADILPAALEISTYKIEDLSGISSQLARSPIVDRVIYQQDVVSTLVSWTNALRRIGIVTIGLLAAVAVFIMMTIIGIKISRKRDDIDIMKLIGATNWYIRWPFIFEGALYGAVGAFFGWAISSGVLIYATPFLESFLKGIPVFPLPWTFFLELLGVEVIFAILLGSLSSFFAVLRYLK